MRAALYLCLLLSFACALLRHLIESAGARWAARTVSLLGSLLVVSVLLFTSDGDRQFRMPEITDNSDYFQALSAETLDAVYSEAEKEVASRLSDGIAAVCGHIPTACSVTLTREELRISSVRVRFSRADMLLSSYEVKAYIREKCGAETKVEVVFE